MTNPKSTATFDAEIAAEVSRNTYSVTASEDPPRVFFEVTAPAELRADPEGAQICCYAVSARWAEVVIETNEGRHIACLEVHAPLGVDLTTETIRVASALYWAWWHASKVREAVHG